MTVPTPVPTRPVVKQHLRLEVVPPHHLFVMGEDVTRVLSGDAYIRSVPLLDGQRTVSDVITELQAQVFPPDVYTALHNMAQLGLLVEGPRSPLPEAGFWHAVGVDIATVSARLSTARVGLMAAGTGDVGSLAKALQDVGVHVSDEEPDLLIVVTDDYLEPALKAINEQALARGPPWMTVKLTGRSLWLGPIFRSGTSGCWSCLADLLRRGGVDDLVAPIGGNSATPPPFASLPTTIAAGVSQTALFVAIWLALGSCELEGRMLMLNMVSLQSDQLELIRSLQCESCGPQRNSRPS